MKTASILLPNLSAVRQFSRAVECCGCEVEVLVGRSRLDARSLLGLVSLALGRPATLELRCADEAEADRLLEALRDYLL